jgi:LysM repeat protein
MKRMNFLLVGVLLFVIFIIASCSPTLPKIANTPILKGQLVLYSTVTPTNTPKPPDAPTSTPKPSLTPTPRTHKVKAGEDLGGIAYQYKITLKALMQANPNVSTYAMSVGTVLIIPNSSEPSVKQSAPELPTPVGIKIGQPHCFHTTEEGLECFTLVINPLDTAVENVSAMVNIQSLSDFESVSQPALPPINLIPAGASMPLLTYFPPEIPDVFQTSANLLTALPVSKNNDRYLPVKINHQKIVILSDNLSAEISGEIELDKKGIKASQVWVAGIAYDQAGNVIGARRWESDASLKSGKTMPFALRVYAQEGKINKVEVFVEARP